MVERGDITIQREQTAGRPVDHYQLTSRHLAVQMA
jgi:hypothetical protein